MAVLSIVLYVIDWVASLVAPLSHFSVCGSSPVGESSGVESSRVDVEVEVVVEVEVQVEVVVERSGVVSSRVECCRVETFGVEGSRVEVEVEVEVEDAVAVAVEVEWSGVEWSGVESS